MTKLSVLFATAVALATPGMAEAANPDGDHTFTGIVVDVRKNLPIWTRCTVTAVINVLGGVPRLKSVAVTGSGACTAISFAGLPSSPLNTWSSPIIHTYLRVNIAAIPPLFPADACEGYLHFLWGGNNGFAPRTLTFQAFESTAGMSDVPDAYPNNPGATGNPCRIRGDLYQTSSPLLDL